MVTLGFKDDGKIYVKSPYLPAFIKDARQLGGKFDRPYWVFDANHVGLVRAKLVEHYKHDGSTGPTVKMHIRLDGFNLRRWDSQFIAGPIEVLSKLNRDSAPKLGAGCVVIAGRLLSRGGSRSNPEITFEDGTIIEVAEMPLLAAQRLVDENPEAYSIVLPDDIADDEGVDCYDLTDAEAALVQALRDLPAERLQLVLEWVSVPSA